MKCRFLGCLVAVCLVAPGWVGCSEGDDETLPPMCLSTCYSDVSFALATPLSGREIVISVGFPDGSVERIDCQPGDGSVACIPVTSRVKLSFAVDGSLQSLNVRYAPAGSYAVQIEADGAPAAAGAFSFAGPVYGDPCGGYSACSGTQTFTIAH